MKLQKYKDNLLERLRGKKYAKGYLAEALEDESIETFLLALRDVVEAQGGIGRLAEKLSISRQSVYKILSEDGNPKLDTLQEILRALGLRMSVIQDEAA